MKRRHPLAVVAALVFYGLSVAAAVAAESTERPFGGPPPPRNAGKQRGFKGKGTTCRTPAGTCKLTEPKAKEADCSCPGGSTGKVE